MTQFTFFTVALKNLNRKSFRTGVLISAIALLVSLLIFAVSFTMSVAASLHKASERLGADLVVVPVGARSGAEEFLLEAKNTSFYMKKSLLERVRTVEGVESMTYQTYLSSINGMCCDIMPTKIVAFDQETDFIIKPWLQKAVGRELRKGEAIAGFGTSENLGLGLLEVEPTIFNNRFKMIGVLEQTGTGLDNALFMTEENLFGIIGSGKSPLHAEEISIIFIKVKAGYDPDYVGKLIEGEIVEVDVIARSGMGSRFLNILADINKIFLITISLSCVLTVFLVWAIFSAIANERAKEIGIMRAIGAKESHIVKLFLLEVLILGMTGSVVGMIAGTYLSTWLGESFSLVKNISANLSVIQQILIAILGLIIGTGICITGAMLPINRIKKMEPLLAIKEE
ncbi:MAG: ABC transporter permease [Proteobacteria bacterium]|nr:ABC transporter permease [Pseudomonadota bacterium]MBU1709010.1 ABC transporter permease [Pseudomonadota bacterium]